MTKTIEPREALVIDCSEDPDVSKKRAAIYADLDRAFKEDDVDGIKTNLRDLEQLLESEGPRESRVALTDEEWDRHLVEQAASHKNGLLAQIKRGLAGTDHQVVEALENGQPVPKAIAAHRKKLRDAAGVVAKAETHADLAAIEIPALPAR